MKKSLGMFPPVLLFALLTTASQAQMSIGLRGGANFASLSVDDVPSASFEPRTRPCFALLFNFPLSPSTSIQIEPGFSQRGAKGSSDASITMDNQTYRVVGKSKLMLDYIEMPVLFQYKPKLGKLEGIFSLGPEVRLLTAPVKVKANIKIFVDGVLEDEMTEEASASGEEGFRKFDFGMVGGAGIACPLGTLKIFAEGRYHYGLKDLSKDNEYKVYNRGASVHAGVLLPVGKGK
jgi:hypothetical protein